MSTYVVGDIQGCFEPFQRLLKKVKFNSDKDRLWSLGDLVNRGPDNIGTLRWFCAHRDNVTLVLGNHDLHLMAVSCGARRPSRKDNLEDILDAPDREQLIEWLRLSPSRTSKIASLWCAGIPNLDHTKHAGSRLGVENALQGARCKDFLTEMYGNDHMCGMTASAE